MSKSPSVSDETVERVHTPTPWFVNSDGIEGHDTMVCFAPSSEWDFKYWQANAAFIVKAANCHESYKLALIKIAGMDLSAEEMSKLAAAALKAGSQ